MLWDVVDELGGLAYLAHSIVFPLTSGHLYTIFSTPYVAEARSVSLGCLERIVLRIAGSSTTLTGIILNLRKTW